MFILNTTWPMSPKSILKCKICRILYVLGYTAFFSIPTEHGAPIIAVLEGLILLKG